MAACYALIMKKTLAIIGCSASIALAPFVSLAETCNTWNPACSTGSTCQFLPPSYDQGICVSTGATGGTNKRDLPIWYGTGNTPNIPSPATMPKQKGFLSWLTGWTGVKTKDKVTPAAHGIGIKFIPATKPVVWTTRTEAPLPTVRTYTAPTPLISADLPCIPTKNGLAKKTGTGAACAMPICIPWPKGSNGDLDNQCEQDAEMAMEKAERPFGKAWEDETLGLSVANQRIQSVVHDTNGDITSYGLADLAVICSGYYTASKPDCSAQIAAYPELQSLMNDYGQYQKNAAPIRDAYNKKIAQCKADYPHGGTLACSNTPPECIGE